MGQTCMQSRLIVPQAPSLTHTHTHLQAPLGKKPRVPDDVMGTFLYPLPWLTPSFRSSHREEPVYACTDTASYFCLCVLKNIDWPLSPQGPHGDVAGLPFPPQAEGERREALASKALKLALCPLSGGGWRGGGCRASGGSQLGPPAPRREARGGRMGMAWGQ